MHLSIPTVEYFYDELEKIALSAPVAVGGTLGTASLLATLAGVKSSQRKQKQLNQALAYTGRMPPAAAAKRRKNLNRDALLASALVGAGAATAGGIGTRSLMKNVPKWRKALSSALREEARGVSRAAGEEFGEGAVSGATKKTKETVDPRNWFKRKT